MSDSRKTTFTFQDAEFFQHECELHTISLAYVTAKYDVKNMSLDEFSDKCHEAYNHLSNKNN